MFAYNDWRFAIKRFDNGEQKTLVSPRN